jgi:hypothetical protein
MGTFLMVANKWSKLGGAKKWLTHYQHIITIINRIDDYFFFIFHKKINRSYFKLDKILFHKTSILLIVCYNYSCSYFIWALTYSI